MSVTALGALIEDQRRRLGSPGHPMSYRALEARTVRAGHKVGYARIQQLATEPIANVPPTATILALAEALQLPASVVADAALESVGLRRPAAPSSRWVTIAAAAEEMPERKRRALEAQVETLLAMHRAPGED